jgi:glycosyltransferase involved in cell wall biosynthesis
MKLSIAIITHNRKAELLRAIESCLKYRIKDMEFVIVDNNSQDGTQEYIESYLNSNNVAYNYFYSHENLGVAGGRNKAFSLATGEYVFSLDDDAVVETEDFFQKICNKMDSNDDIVAAAVEIYEPNSERYLKGKVYKSNNGIYQDLRVFSFNGGAHILRRNFFEQRILYPNKLVFGSEELYPSLIAHKENMVIAYFEKLKVLHLPSTVKRVEGKERILNIILNTHIIRKLCYPFLILPVLDILFRARIIRHGLWRHISYQEIMDLYKSRYDSDEVNRMSMSCFCRLIGDVGLFHLL